MPDAYGTSAPVVPLSPEQLSQWRQQIAEARTRRESVMRWAEANLARYAPPLDGNPDAYGSEINTNRDFTLVERKKAALFYQKPDVTAIPSPLLADQPELLEVHQQILNEKLGPDGVDVESLVDRVLFDVLCPTGTGWSILGYEATTVPTPIQVPAPATTTLMPGAVLGLSPPPLTYQTVLAPVPIFQDCFWSWFSPKQALKPVSARTTESDTWPWIGMEFELPTALAIRKGWVPADYQGEPSSAELHFQHGSPTPTESVVRGVLIFYQSALFREDRPHPKHQTELILIEGRDDPAVHKDSAYQTLTPQGTLSPDSLLGYPIHPCTIRVLTDAADVPSDCTISAPLVNELNRFREQMLEQRDANVMRWMYSTDRLPPDALAKIVRSPIGGMIGVPEEAFVGDGAIKELPHGTYPRENFTFNDYLDNDLARTHAIDAEQSGAGNPGEKSATESQIQQNNVNARLGRERGRVLQWYLKGVTKYSAILQRLMPVEDAAKIVGPQAAQQWDQWRRQIPASLAFTAMPDSSQRNDLAVDRKRALDEYTFFANDPFINRLELLKTLMPKLRYPMKVVQSEPPELKPEPGKHSLALKGEDLNPLAPQFPIILEILQQDGLTISPQAIQQAQQSAQTALLAAQIPAQATGQGAPPPNEQHGGKVPQLESLSKHANALTGGMQGMATPEAGGEPAPLGAGGTVQ
jgi:hypothetical protein